MWKRLPYLAVFLIVLAFSTPFSAGCGLFHPPQYETESAAALAIEKASNKLFSAFKEVRRADKAGANVEQQVKELNQAENHLGLAITAKEEKQYSTAIAEATIAEEISEKVEAEMKELRKDTELAGALQYFLIPLIAIGIGITGLFAWKRTKSWREHRKERKILDLHIKY